VLYVLPGEQNVRHGCEHVADDEMTVVRLDSAQEIQALHRMLFTRKFDGPEDVYFGSPFIASVQNKLVDALAAQSAAQAAQWSAWRTASRHLHILEKVRQHLANTGTWWADASGRAASLRP
jgi:hypothetical protein